MKNKSMLTKISCITLAGLITLSGHAFASENRDLAIEKIQTDSSVSSLLADKVLRYGSNYDRRLYEYIEEKDYVGGTNASWAIVATKLLENANPYGTTYSAKHMDYSTALDSTTGLTNDKHDAHNRTLGSGGNMKVALGYMTSSRGPVIDSDKFPWDGKLDRTSLSTLNSDEWRKGRVESYVKFPNIYKETFKWEDEKGKEFYYTWALSNKKEWYDASQIEENRNNIKEHIIKYGSVGAKIYRDDNYMKALASTKTSCTVSYYDDGDRYYYITTYDKYDIRDTPYYYNNQEDKNPNNDVVIVGWDDNVEIPGAPGKGAYIVMDTRPFSTSIYSIASGPYTEQQKQEMSRNWLYYRREWKYYEGGWWYKTNAPDGTKGSEISKTTNFYYVSYYDYYIESEVYGIKKISNMAPDKVYEHDPLGLSTSIEGLYPSTEVYGANVWNRTNSSIAESLDSISIASEQKMKYEVYVNPKDGDLTEEKLTKVAETDYLDAGYNTIYFDSSIILTGEKFAVAVKYISQTGDYMYETAKIGVESPTEEYYYKDPEKESEYKVGTRNVRYWENATSYKGQSYLGSNLKNWVDMSTRESTKNTNICIKAFTTELPSYKIPPTEINLKSKITNEFGLEEEHELSEVNNILKGDTMTLVAEILPEDAANKNVLWTSSNKTVATVDKEGVVTTHEAGTATITARSATNQILYAECKIDVRVPVNNFVLNKNQVTILAGETNVLAAIIGPNDATTTKVEWSSNNTEVVRVTEDGLLIGLKQGSAIVTAILRDEAGIHTATCKVSVPESLVVGVLGVSLNKTALTLEKGTRETLTATIMPSDATNTSVVWTSSNKSVAIVNANGRITALSPGTSTITVTTVSGGETATCQVTVTEVATVRVTGIQLNKTATTLNINDTDQLNATVLPNNSNNKKVNWKSDNLNIVEVSSNGRLVAISPGTATITATTEDGGYKATCTVTVARPTVKVTGITINKTAVTLEKDEATQLIAGTQPANADNINITWTSDDEKVAKVDNSGLVTAVGYGTATITAKTEDGGYTKTCVVYVPEKIAVTGIEISAESLDIYKDRTEKLTVNVLPKNADNTNITYEIQDETIATLSGSGVKGLKKGTTTITFKTEDGNFTKTCTITVKELDDSKIEISSNQYEIGQDNKIDNVNQNTTVKDLKDGLTTSENVTIIIKDKDGNVLEDDDLVGTGSTIEISKEIEKIPEGQEGPVKETVKETFTIKVTGDIDGNGKITVTDLSQLKNYIMTGKNLEGIYYEAADINGDGKVTLTDISLMKELLLNSDEEEK